MISSGMSASISLVVTEQDTAIALGSGDVAVLGTPRVVALSEKAAVAALAGSLPGGATTVGTNITLDHLAASGVGSGVTATATVISVKGKEIIFSVDVSESDKLIAKGAHTRFVVDRTRFIGSIS